MDKEKLVVEDKMGPVKDLHARFEKTQLRKPLGEIPTTSTRFGDAISTVNIKSTLQKWETKTYTPFLTPQKQKLMQPEHMTRSEPKGNRFTRGRKFNFDHNENDPDDDDESGGAVRRTSMPAVGAVKNALKQYLANAGQSDKNTQNVASPYPEHKKTKSSRRALVPKMNSIEEDSEDNDENQPLTMKVSTITRSKVSSAENASSFDIGLKGLRKTPAESKVAAETKPMDEWKSPVKSITKANTPCKQKGYIFDEFAVGLRALKSPKKTEIEDQQFTVSGSVEIDEPPFVSSFEVGLKALRTPKRSAAKAEPSEFKEKAEPAGRSLAVGLKALKTPKKVDLIKEMKSTEEESTEEVKSFQVGLKALRKVGKVTTDENSSRFQKREQETKFGVNLKPAKTSSSSLGDTNEDEKTDVKQAFVTLKPASTRPAKEMKDTDRDAPNLTDFKLKLKPTRKLGKDKEVVEKSDDSERVDWNMAKSKLKSVSADDRKPSKTDDGDDSKEIENLDIREDKIDWNQAKMKLKRVTSTDKVPTDEDGASGKEDVSCASEDPDQATGENARLSALSKINPMDETLLVDLNDTVSDGELEGMVKSNMHLLDDSSLRLGDSLVEMKSEVDVAKTEKSKENVHKDLVKSPKRQSRTGDEDKEDQPSPKVAKEEREESIPRSEESKDEKASALDRKRVRSDDSDASSSSSEKGEVFKAPIAAPARSMSNKSPRKKKPKLLSYDDSDYLTSSLSPGNLFIDPNTPSTVGTPQSSKNVHSDSEMDTTSPIKSPMKETSQLGTEMSSPVASPTQLKRQNTEEVERKTENKSSPEVYETLQEEDGCKIFSSTPAGTSEDSYIVKKKAKVDNDTPSSESKFTVSAASTSPTVTHKKLDWSVEEYSDTTTDIIRRWKERRHFLNLKGSPRTVEERMEEEEETGKKEQHPLLPEAEDTAHSKVSNFLSSLPGSTEGKEVKVNQISVPEKKSRLSNHSKRSSMQSHSSVRSREEMEADLDKGMKELERRLQMFDDDDEDSPICSAIRKGPAQFAAKMNKTATKVSKRTKEETISESDEENNEKGGENEEKRMKPSTSGSDVLDFIKEKRTRLMEIQDESIHLDSDTDADDSQLDLNQDSGISREGRGERRYPQMGISSGRRRRSRSVGRPVPVLGSSSPKNTFTEKALNRLGLCTPARHHLEPVYPKRKIAQSQLDVFCTPQRSNRTNVYIVDMEQNDTSDDYDERFHTPLEGSTDDSYDENRATKTQEGEGSDLDTSPRASIADRLSQLQQRQQDDWKRRIGKSAEGAGVAAMAAEIGKVKLREKTGETNGTERPTSIADRMSLLQGAQKGWQKRVSHKDVKQFTVEGKLSMSGRITSPDSPVMARRKQLQRDSESSGGSNPSSPTKPSPIRFPGLPPTSPKSPTGGKVFRLSTTPPSTSLASSMSISSGSAKSTPTIGTTRADDTEYNPRTQLTYTPATEVEVPQLDETFASFYEEKSMTELSMQKVDVTVDDFDHVFMESGNMLQATRKVKATKKTQSRSKNPLKALRNREDIKSEYSEVRSNVADKEVTRIKREQIAGQANFAQEALAGLASKENFSKVLLKKTEGTVSTPGGSSSGCDPYKDVMLLHIKGRRHCQMRLVEPSHKSINSGDAYVLVTPGNAYSWIGDFCNVIEKSKVSEIATMICQKHDLGYRGNAEPHVITEEKQDFTKGRDFWKVLGGRETYLDPGPQEEDELYEMYMAQTNRIYRVEGDAMIPHQEYWGTTPKYEMLKTNEILVFDFGSEMYVWTGKKVPFSERKSAIRLARELWDMGYDFTDCQVNPMSPMRSEATGGLPLKCDRRPDWALFGKVNQNMETILFREKFLDWPDQSRLIKVKGQDDEKDKTDSGADLQVCDVDEMVTLDTTPVSTVLEGSHVGRGSEWVDTSDGIRRAFEILTLSMRVWHILEYDHLDMDENSYGQFHDGDTYVVRWHYVISQKGMKDLKGQAVRHSYTGRERCVYFFWHGRHSSITEKGASALMTVELDEERGPQVRVVQGKEPPCFVQLFRDTGMMVHIGKREEEETNTQGPWKMYTVRNELPNEGYLLEVPIAISSLRSCTSILLLNTSTGTCYIWHGAKSPLHTQQRAFECAECIKNRKPVEIGISASDVSILEMREGNEPGELWNVLGSKDRTKYFSLLKDPNPYNVSPRLFHFQSVSGTFEAIEILNPCRNFDLNTPFPFYQSDLYKASQPALFMLDLEHTVFLWQGWWPDASELEDNVETGSAPARFNRERMVALDTTLQYCKKKYSYSPPPAYLIYAGVEPLCFTNMFPLWEEDTKAKDATSKEGKQPGEMVAIDDLLNKLSKMRFTYNELQERPLPEGVDPLRMEAYLHDEEFEEVLQMSREDFSALPAWKQSNIKKEFGLF